MKDKLIVGIDPGTTAGVALINLNGKLIDVKSGRDFGKEKIIAYIISKGSPVMIATDKKKVPSTVEKISRSFDAKLVSPDKDLSQEEKDELAGNIDLDDSHQLDALASALHAYKINFNKLEKIEDTMQQLNLLDHVEEVKTKILKEDSENITAAIESTLDEGKEEVTKEKERRKEKSVDKNGKIEELKEELSRTKKSVEMLRDYSEKLKEQKKELEEKLEKRKEKFKEVKEGKKNEVMEMDEIKKLGETVQSLRRGINDKEEENKKLWKKLEKFKELEKKRREGFLVAYIVDNFNKGSLEDISKLYGLQNSILFFKNIKSPNLSIIDILNENKVRGVIGNFEGDVKEKLIENDIPIISTDELEFDGKIENEVKFFSPEEFESGKNVNKKGFISWLKKYKKR